MNETISIHNDLKKILLKALVVIQDRDESQRVAEFFRQFHGNHLLYQYWAEGTASSEILDYLGLGKTEKVVTLCLTPNIMIPKLLAEVCKEFKIYAPGNGIAFIMPLSGVSNPIFKMLNEEAIEGIKKEIESEVEKVRGTLSHDMIISVVNIGYSEELMTAAKAAGATGGTVIHARRVGEQSVLWGISVQAEKEVVAILTRHENKLEIMKAISQQCGATTEAQGLIFAMPVETVAGIDTDSLIGV